MDPAQNIKVVPIHISLDGRVLIEFIGPNVRDGFVGEFSYLYVTEPANIIGNRNYKYEPGFDTTYYEHYDCNFTKPGWYKICRSYDNTKPVNAPIDGAKFEKSEF
jgi:hypothetical protein